MTRRLFVTLDTEVDKDRLWRVSDPPSFRSVVEGVPRVLSPLFDEFGVVPTYLLSPEVIAHGPAAEVLASLGDRAELGTHLHAEFAPPGELSLAQMAGKPTDAVQAWLAPGLEERKLAGLTDLCERTFGRRPTSFRAGRFGIGAETLELLARLGYTVDSSVTPGIVWRYAEGTLDFTGWEIGPRRVDTAAGQILELPVSVVAGSGLARRLHGRTDLPRRILRRASGRRGRFHWLRPSWASGEDLVRYVEESDEEQLVMMLHSMEVVPGASPYAADRAGVERIVGAMRTLLAHCERTGIAFGGLSEAA